MSRLQNVFAQLDFAEAARNALAAGWPTAAPADFQATESVIPGEFICNVDSDAS